MNENQMQTILTYKNLLLHLGILLSGYLGVAEWKSPSVLSGEKFSWNFSL